MKDILRHLALYYSDWHIKHDMDCVPSNAVIKAYVKLRQDAPGYNPRSYRPGVRHNSHEAWMTEAALKQKSKTCQHCSEPFEAVRKTAKFCSARCRKAASR